MHPQNSSMLNAAISFLKASYVKMICTQCMLTGGILFTVFFLSPAVLIGQVYWNQNGPNYTTGSLGINADNPTAKLEVAGTGTTIFRNRNYSVNGYLEGAINIFKFNNNSNKVNTVINLGNYWNSDSQISDILAIDFRAADGGGMVGGSEAAPQARIKVQTAWVAPFMDFDVAGNTVMRLQNGNAGIGELDAKGKLHVTSFSTTDENQLVINNSHGFPSEYSRSNISFRSQHDQLGSWEVGKITVLPSTLTNKWNESSNGTMKFRLKVNGNLQDILVLDRNYVGIGTDKPTSMLTVAGDIHSREVKVTVDAGAPDYVFEEDYDLLSLAATEAYIKQNKHLPEIPSAKEMEADGLNLKQMNLLLLKKVEELTLHLIEATKKIDNQQKEITQLKEAVYKN